MTKKRVDRKLRANSCSLGERAGLIQACSIAKSTERISSVTDVYNSEYKKC